MRKWLERLRNIPSDDAHPEARWALRVALVAAALLVASGLHLPALTDDWFQILMLEDFLGIRTAHAALFGRTDPLGLFDMYHFFKEGPSSAARAIQEGVAPWWTWPGLKVAFWRPLTSQLAVLDYSLFGRGVLGPRLHSGLWYLGLILAVGSLYRRSLGSAWGLALLLFAIDDSHWMPVCWLANRNSLVSAALGFGALVAHLRWREEGWRPGAVLAPLGFGLGLLAGEAGAGPLAYLICYEALARAGGLRARILALVPTGSVSLLWALAYKGMGYGAVGSGMYVDPVGEPLEWLKVAAVRLPLLMGNMVGGLPSHATLVQPELAYGMVPWGVAVTLGAGWLLIRLWDGLPEDTRQSLRWMVPGSVLSLLPVLSTAAMDRLLLIPSVGGMAAGSALLCHCWPWEKALPGWKRGVGGALAFFHIVLPVLLVGGMLQLFSGLEPALARAYEGLSRSDGDLRDDYVLLVASSDLTMAMNLAPWTLYHQRPGVKGYQIGSPAPSDHQLRRLDAFRLEITALGPDMGASLPGQLFRSSAHPFKVGEQVRVAPYTYTVEELGPTGPRRITLQADRPLEQIRLMKWGTQGLEPLTLPPVGETLVLPHVPGPMQM